MTSAQVGIEMKMHSNVYNTGIVFYHRFYMLQSFEFFNRLV